MPRFRRVIRPGDLVHVISRFVNREFRLTCNQERNEYRRRFGKRVIESDWRSLSYALMSSHVHHGLVAGTEPFESLIKSVHAPFATWLNRRQRRLGPVFAERPKTVIIHPAWAARLVAYHHNNPARAAVVGTALESDWTSHRAYVGEVGTHDFLSVELGLDLMGFGSGHAGRNAFARYVDERKADPHDLLLLGDLRRAKSELREALRAAVCVAHPRTGPGGLDYAPSIRAARWSGSLDALVALVASAQRLTALEITSSSRRRDLVSARRKVALIAAMLGRTDRDVGLHLGISETAVRKLRRSGSEQDRAEASELAERLLRAA